LCFIKILPFSGPIQWARGDVGLKPSAAARHWALAFFVLRAAAPELKPLRLPRALNHVNYFKASPTDLPFGSWYLTGTNHFRLTIWSGGN